jgi:hypothetical protein
MVKVNKVYNDEGIKFASKLEKYCYEHLIEAEISFIFQYKYVLQDKFRYNGEAIRQITLSVDFYLPELNVIIDTKGFQREDNKLKWKMLKAQLQDTSPVIYFPKSQKAVLEILKSLQPVCHIKKPLPTKN